MRMLNQGNSVHRFTENDSYAVLLFRALVEASTLEEDVKSGKKPPRA